MQPCLNISKKLIQLNPCAPADIWLAVGICHFKLKNLPKAKFSMEHVLSIDPTNSMALTSLGIIEIQMSPSDPVQREKAAHLFQKSFEIDDSNPLTMKHLADHFFFDDELEISETLCKRALMFCEKLKRPNNADLPNFRRDIILLKSDLHFIYGKILHKR